MGRDTSNSRQMRARIAQLAARIIADDGVADYGLAKRKAARQIGAPSRNLPDNEEIEQAIIEHELLYRPDEHRDRLTSLRRDARDLMKLLAPFDPHLVGPVLTGSAVRYSDLDLHLYADSPKEVEMFLLNRGYDFKTREARFAIGGDLREVPEYAIDFGENGAKLVVFGRDDIRAAIRYGADGRPVERARLPWVEAQISGASPDFS